LKFLRVSLKTNHQLGEALMKARNAHKASSLKTHRSLHRNLEAILIFCFRDVEHGEERGGNDEQCCVHKVTSRTDPLANPKCQADHWVISEISIFVEKTLWIEFFRIWVYLWVMQDCPDTSQMSFQIKLDSDGQRTRRWLVLSFLLDRTIKSTIQGQN
jgi:hypothetical protein